MSTTLHNLTTEQLEQLREAHTLREIGEQYGISYERVRQICAGRGIDSRKLRGRARQRRIAAAVARSVQVGIQQAAQEYGVTTVTMRAWGAPPPERIWSQEKLIAAGHGYVKKHGGPLSASCFSVHQAARLGRFDLVQRFHDGHYPTVTTVVHYFGSWNNYIRACGWEPNPSGPPKGRDK